ncbi:hypothetical protein AAD001_02710 [Colwelliaceae bacterium 6471]
MILIVSKTSYKDFDGHRKTLRDLMEKKGVNTSKVELIFKQATHFKNMSVECELSLQKMNKDKLQIFAVGYSEVDAFEDAIVKLKGLL